MAQPGPKTSWDDLAHLGWSQQQVYDTLNPLRGYTMHGLSDLHLNDDAFPSPDCYNVTIGAPYRFAQLPIHEVSNVLGPVKTFDNTNGSEPLITLWTDKWSTESTATLILTRGPSINLEWSVTIKSVADSSFDITMSTNDTEITEVEKKDLEETYKVTVAPGKILDIHRPESVTTRRSIYAQKYGIKGLIVTSGDEYGGSKVWGYSEAFLNGPSSDMVFVGLSQSSTFSHVPVGDGTIERVPDPVVKVAKAITTTKPEDGKKTALQYAFPIPIETPKEAHK